MEKIVLVINSHHFNLHTIEHACYLARLTHSRLSGIFLKDDYELAPEIKFSESYYKEISDKAIKERKPLTMDVDHGVRFFLDACLKRGVKADASVKGKPDYDKHVVLDEITSESRFADLLVMDPETSFNHSAESLPSPLARDVLANAECPVVLSPHVFHGIEEIVFCYDTSKSAIFAMKQFTYLFPQFAEKKVTLLAATRFVKKLDEKEHVGAWLKNHYSQIGFEILEGQASDELFKYFLGKQNTFVVMGAYGRSALSNFFRKSSADLLMRVVDLPLFIAHY